MEKIIPEIKDKAKSTDKKAAPVNLNTSKIGAGKTTAKKVEATIIEEKDLVNENKEKSSTNNSKEQSSNTAKENNTKSDKTNDFKKGTAEINLDDDKDSKKKAKVNFMSEGFMKDYLSQKTEKNTEESNDSNASNAGQSSDGKSSQPSSQASSNVDFNSNRVTESGLSPEDFRDFANVAMEILDMGISQLMRFYAKDNTSEPYELPKNKMDRLSRQLGNLFVKYNTKFSLEFMFFVTLCICYSGSFAEAKKQRKIITENGGVVPKRNPGRVTKG